MSRRHAFIALCAAALLLPAGSQGEDKGPVFLGAIELKRIEGAPADRFEVRLFHKAGRRLAFHLAKERSYAVVRRTDHLAVTSPEYSFPRKRDGGSLAPSFVNDFDLPAFGRLRKEIVAIYGEKPSDADLVEYVNRYILKKNYNRGFDVASLVVERREGDCTEHAVLLVSLMRMFNIPARMVLGIKMFNAEGVFSAFGHAWVEYLSHGEWKAADPTLAVGVDRSYLPVGTMKNEGLDYGMDLISLLQRMPYRIEVSGL